MKRKFTEQQIIRREKLIKLQELGVNPFYNSFKPSINSKELQDKFSTSSKEKLEKNSKLFSLYGRIMMLRNQGKAAFLSLQDGKGIFQVYIKSSEVSKLNWKIFELIDLGDVIGVKGSLMKTNTGHLTLRVKSLVLLAKSLTPLPDKFKGLEDIEEIYRRRYLDLIMNNDSKQVFLNRVKIINEIKSYLNSKDFLEVETPILSSIIGGASAKPFETHHNALDMDLTLRIATELPLKRLIVGGLERVYEIGRIFRNEGISNRHNPEFTSIELYEVNSDMNGMIKIAENVINHVSKKVVGTDQIIYEGTPISLKKPFKKIEMVDLIKTAINVDFNKVTSLKEAIALAKQHKIKIEKHWNSIGYFINAFFEEFGEKLLVQPTFVTGYPKEVSPLAKMRKGSLTLTDRFELFIKGREYANGYSELNDADDQYNRFLSQQEEAKNGNEEANDMDLDFIEALEYGLPATGGLGIGIDRLVMLLTNSSSIRDVILFPLQKHRTKNGATKK